MKIKSQVALITLSLLSASATFAQDHEIVHEPPRYTTEYVYAKVTRVSPVYDYISHSKPVKECWDEPVSGGYGHYRGNPVGGALAGGIIGGVIGHQIGDGRGRDLSTALGTIIGAQVGHDAAYVDDYSGGIQYRQVCEVVDRDDGFDVVQDGYQVSYRYQGKDYHAHLPYDPGDRIKLKVQVKQPAY
jgi:uncharacterized protein YcfJ